jgi:membrane protein implicated in regulation of membrane protease activity
MGSNTRVQEPESPGASRARLEDLSQTALFAAVMVAGLAVWWSAPEDLPLWFPVEVLGLMVVAVLVIITWGPFYYHRRPSTRKPGFDRGRTFEGSCLTLFPRVCNTQGSSRAMSP